MRTRLSSLEPIFLWGVATHKGWFSYIRSTINDSVNAVNRTHNFYLNLFYLVDAGSE